MMWLAIGVGVGFGAAAVFCVMWRVKIARDVVNRTNEERDAFTSYMVQAWEKRNGIAGRSEETQRCLVDALERIAAALSERKDCWECGCGHWNGCELAICAECGRTVREGQERKDGEG